MVDTIILRIHDTAKYENLIRNLDVLDSKGYTTETTRIEKGKIPELQKKGFRKSTHIVDALKLNRSGEFLLKSKVAKQMNASNHYCFAYRVDYTKEYIEF